MQNNPSLERLIAAARAFATAQWAMAGLSLYDRHPYQATYEHLVAARNELESAAIALDMEEANAAE